MDDMTCMSGVLEAPKETPKTTIPIYFLETWIEGPKFAHLPEFIRKLAMQCEVEVVSLDVRSRLIRETVFFKIQSYDKYKADDFCKQLSQALQEWMK